MSFSISVTSFTTVVKFSYPVLVIKMLSAHVSGVFYRPRWGGERTFDADPAYLPVLLEHVGVDVRRVLRVFEVRLDDEPAEVDLVGLASLETSRGVGDALLARR
jgi:hypothetical protein